MKKWTSKWEQVTRATDWPWSSAIAYEGGEAPVPISTWWFTGED